MINWTNIIATLVGFFILYSGYRFIIIQNSGDKPAKERAYILLGIFTSIIFITLAILVLAPGKIVTQEFTIKSIDFAYVTDKEDIFIDTVEGIKFDVGHVTVENNKINAEKLISTINTNNNLLKNVSITYVSKLNYFRNVSNVTLSDGTVFTFSN